MPREAQRVTKIPRDTRDAQRLARNAQRYPETSRNMFLSIKFPEPGQWYQVLQMMPLLELGVQGGYEGYR